jgi:hypothetical protein
MTGYVRKDTTNNIADGNVINAADLDSEFDGVQDAFNASTGHKHDGTAGEGATINALGPTQDVTVSATLLAPKTTNTVDIGSSALKFKDLFLAGNASVGGTLAVTGVATLTANPVLSAGTANGVAYLNGSKAVTSSSALTFNGTYLGVGSGTTGLGEVEIQQSATTAALWVQTGGTTSSYTIADFRNGSNTPVLTLFGNNTSYFSGSVGIGTNSPLKALDVSFASGARRFLVSYDDSVITIKGAGSTDNPEALRVIGDNIRFNTGTTGSGTERARIDGSGRIAFSDNGTSSDRLINASFSGATTSGSNQFGLVLNPTYPNTATSALYNIYAGPNISAGATITNVFGLYLEAINAPGSTITNRYGIYQAGSSDRNVFAGNVLLGTTVSRTKLTVSTVEISSPSLGTADGAAFFGNGTAAYGTMFGTSGTGDGWIQQQRVDGTAAAYNLLLNPSGGNVLVGITSSGGAGGISLYPNGSGSSGQVAIAKVADGVTNNAMAFIASGSVIGTIAISNTNTAYNTSSDYRLKNITGSLTGYKERLMSLQPKQGTWIVDGSEFRGFLAHEFAVPYRASVTGEKDDIDENGNPIMQAMQASSSEVMADLVAMVNDLITENALLKARLDAANL